MKEGGGGGGGGGGVQLHPVYRNFAGREADRGMEKGGPPLSIMWPNFRGQL